MNTPRSFSPSPRPSLAARWACRALAGLLVVTAAVGCESYALRGAVVEGTVSQVLVVDKNDPRLSRQGLSDARIDVALDPRAIRPRKQSPVVTDDHGQFHLPIDAEGAGFLEYDASVIVQHEGHVHAEQTVKLPGGDKRLLILLKPGRDTYKPEADIIDESIREGQRSNMIPRN